MRTIPTSLFLLAITGLAPASLLLVPQEKPESAPTQTTVVHCGRLLAVPGQEARADQTIVVKGDRIAEHSGLAGLAKDYFEYLWADAENR